MLAPDARAAASPTAAAVAVAHTALAAATAATTGRALQAERVGHEYATSLSMLASTAAIQRTFQQGGTAVNSATQLSLRNAQKSTKFWPGAQRYDDGIKLSSSGADEEEDKD